MRAQSAQVSSNAARAVAAAATKACGAKFQSRGRAAEICRRRSVARRSEAVA